MSSVKLRAGGSSSGNSTDAGGKGSRSKLARQQQQRPRQSQPRRRRRTAPEQQQREHEQPQHIRNLDTSEIQRQRGSRSSSSSKTDKTAAMTASPVCASRPPMIPDRGDQNGSQRYSREDARGVGAAATPPTALTATAPVVRPRSASMSSSNSNSNLTGSFDLWFKSSFNSDASSITMLTTDPWDDDISTIQMPKPNSFTTNSSDRKKATLEQGNAADRLPTLPQRRRYPRRNSNEISVITSSLHSRSISQHSVISLAHHPSPSPVAATPRIYRHPLRHHGNRRSSLSSTSSPYTLSPNIPASPTSPHSSHRHDVSNRTCSTIGNCTATSLDCIPDDEDDYEISSLPSKIEVILEAEESRSGSNDRQKEPPGLRLDDQPQRQQQQQQRLQEDTRDIHQMQGQTGYMPLRGCDGNDSGDGDIHRCSGGIAVVLEDSSDEDGVDRVDDDANRDDASNRGDGSGRVFRDEDDDWSNLAPQKLLRRRRIPHDCGDDDHDHGDNTTTADTTAVTSRATSSSSSITSSPSSVSSKKNKNKKEKSRSAKRNKSLLRRRRSKSSERETSTANSGNASPTKLRSRSKERRRSRSLGTLREKRRNVSTESNNTSSTHSTSTRDCECDGHDGAVDVRSTCNSAEDVTATAIDSVDDNNDNDNDQPESTPLITHLKRFYDKPSSDTVSAPDNKAKRSKKKTKKKKKHDNSSGKSSSNNNNNNNNCSNHTDASPVTPRRKRSKSRSRSSSRQRLRRLFSSSTSSSAASSVLTSKSKHYDTPNPKAKKKLRSRQPPPTPPLTPLTPETPKHSNQASRQLRKQSSRSTEISRTNSLPTPVVKDVTKPPKRSVSATDLQPQRSFDSACGPEQGRLPVSTRREYVLEKLASILETNCD